MGKVYAHEIGACAVESRRNCSLEKAAQLKAS
jgi:hypothetical protein